jgi:hypothetical protein
MEKRRAALVAQLPSAQGAMIQEQKARIEQLDRQIRLAKARKADRLAVSDASRRDRRRRHVEDRPR